MKFFSALVAAAVAFAPVSAFAKPGVCMIKNIGDGKVQGFDCDIDVQVQQSTKHVVVVSSDDRSMRLTFTPDGKVKVESNRTKGVYPFQVTADGLPVIRFDDVLFHFRIPAQPKTKTVFA